VCTRLHTFPECVHDSFQTVYKIIESLVCFIKSWNSLQIPFVYAILVKVLVVDYSTETLTIVTSNLAGVETGILSVSCTTVQNKIVVEISTSTESQHV